MAADVLESQRLRVLDQDAEDAATARRVADRGTDLVVDPAGDEALELLTLLVEHPERRVAGTRQLTRDGEHTLQQRLEIELGDDVRHDLHQPPQLAVSRFRCGHGRSCARLHLDDARPQPAQSNADQ